jgi:acetyltransferase-like isoleucine patch superfamily enzyme
VGKNCFFDENISIFPNAKTVYIDDDCFLEKGCCIVSSDNEFRVGKNCHIGADSYINGKPFFKMGRYSCIDVGSKVFGSTNMPNDECGNVMSFSCTAPESLQKIRYKGTKLGRNSFIGPNSVVVCAWIGDDVIVGPNSFVNADIESGNVFAGSPAKLIRKSKLSK